MNALSPALALRGILPPDGECSCDECGAENLNRDEISPNKAFAVTTCKACEERILSGWMECSACKGTSGNVRRFHPIRGEYYNDWCERCDGDQRIFVGVPKHILEGDTV